MMKSLVFDSESTTFKKGNPFSRRNKCCAISFLFASDDGIASTCVPWEHSGPVSADYLRVAQESFKDAELVIGFNLKYDLHVIRKCGIITTYKDLPKLWDCQLAQFIIQSQENRFPSLEDSCKYFGIEGKFIDIETEYWDKGIDTPQIPWKVVEQRALSDVDINYQLYLAQMKYLSDKPKMTRLIELANQDLIVLAEMEFNGLKFNVEESSRRAEQVAKEIAEIDANLKSIFGNYDFNFNSVDQLSCLLYGGTIRFDKKYPYEHTFKQGPKQGLTQTRYKHEEQLVTFPRIVEPLENSALKKEGYWSTDDSVLSQLKTRSKAKEVVGLLRLRSEKEGLLSKYLIGFPKTITNMDWDEGTLHSNLNQCVAITGRLSSNNPNIQNIPPEVDDLVQTRFY